MSPTIADRLTECAEATEASLERYLAPGHDVPALATLARATRHGTLQGGKRLRPFLVREGAAALGGDRQAAMPAACAVEMIHSYSLVHDDLPAMDDAETRRGRPSVHAAYDEATAVLVGDALLTEGFAVVAGAGYPPEAAVALVAELARGAGAAGMVGGQMMDLYPGALTEDEVVGIQARKTGALIEAAAVMGGLVAGGDEAQLGALRRYAAALGLAFQIQDDILDVTADAAALGKPAGRDEEAGKATFVGLYGLDGARARVARSTEEAKDAVAGMPSPDVLTELADWQAGRGA